jgi:hypothetical protein
MAKYMLLIYGDAEQWDSMTPEQWGPHDAAHVAFREAAGVQVIGGHQLVSSPVATSLRSDGAGEVLLTDGPFLETKEALGGYYLIEAADLDQALAVAKLCPAPRGGVELRPILDVSGG